MGIDDWRWLRREVSENACVVRCGNNRGGRWSRVLRVAGVMVAAGLSVALAVTVGAPSAVTEVSSVMAQLQRDAADTRVQVSDSVAEELDSPLDRTHRIPVFAHRGFVENGMVENSFDSFDEAIENGCPQIELDIRTSSDGVYYVSHDATLEKVADIDERVDAMTSEELDEVTMVNGESFHRLTDVFERYGDSVYYLIEFKESNASANAFYNVMAQYPELASRVEVQSFYSGILERLETVLPSMFKQLLVGHEATLTKHLNDDYIDSFAVAKHMTTDENIDAVHDAGKEIWSWAPDSSGAITEEIIDGVDGVITDLESAARIAAKAEQQADE